jgi:hypothetical protein
MIKNIKFLKEEIFLKSKTLIKSFLKGYFNNQLKKQTLIR